LPALLAFALCGGLHGCGASSPGRPAETAAPTIVKQPVRFATRTFDPLNPPRDMPPMPAGEQAQCDSSFTSSAVVGGQSRKTGDTSAFITITQITMTLGLDITIWLPHGVTQHVAEHEQGHRQISEHYYETADQIAARVAAQYMGRTVEVSGSDLQAEFNKVLEQMGAEITEEYSRELNPQPTQLLYDRITDHARNDVVAKDAAINAINNVAMEAGR
jgi:hypothetical protein